MGNREAKLYLASASPRRRELLLQLGVIHQQFGMDLDETRLSGEQPAAYVARLAKAKAEAGWRSLGTLPPRPVLGADTAVVVGDAILGKPRDRDHGLAMLAQLSGRWHSVLSAVALVEEERRGLRVQESRVRFRRLDDAERIAYWDSGEPLDKAGGYAIQGRAAAFVAELQGSYSGVMGLPLYETAELLREFAVPF